MKKIKISPSILSADFGNMQNAVVDLQKCGADMIHFDVMDGIFVSNITFGAKMVADLKKHISVPLDVHLMIVKPERYTAAFADAGADIITIHVESTSTDYLLPTIKDIKRRKLKAGVAISPDTPLNDIRQTLDFVDMVLLMSVYPGASGQKFIEKTLKRLQQLKEMIGDRNIEIEIDGGINLQNIEQLRELGVDIAVVGSSILNSTDWTNTIAQLKNGSNQQQQIADIVEEDEDYDDDED
ncbi:MAG: ribulose-phosphate 3-epimerase [Clostridiales bacterium]|jgi:ribulose-phosphate 3-epimerase|nr:ribulose-phosphate 3-epimerase [Clostridiales bacterium]